jgi:hypothetical protein
VTEYIYSRETGAISVDTADMLEEVQNEFKTALGQSLNTQSNTPQGSLITAEAIARNDVMRNNAEYANLLNPDLSYGRFLDAICAFNAIGRGENQATIVRKVLLGGNQATVIPAGSRLQDQDGVIFTTIDQVTIPASKAIVVDIIASEPGALEVPEQDLTIIDGVIGWGSAEVTLTSVVEPGSTALKDGALKNVRRRRLAALGIGSSGAILASVLAVPNVRSALVVENNTGATGLVKGVTFTLPNAVWVCVAGEAVVDDVAAALYRTHHMGIPWDYGNTGNGTPVQSPNGVSTPDPSSGIFYNVKFTQAVEYDAYFKIKVRRQPGASTPTETVKEAVVAYGNGEIDGEDGFVVGASIYAFDVAGAISAQMPGLSIVEIKVACVLKGLSPPVDGAYAFEFAMAAWGIASTNVGSVLVEILP